MGVLSSLGPPVILVAVVLLDVVLPPSLSMHAGLTLCRAGRGLCNPAGTVLHVASARANRSRILETTARGRLRSAGPYCCGCSVGYVDEGYRRPDHTTGRSRGCSQRQSSSLVG